MPSVRFVCDPLRVPYVASVADVLERGGWDCSVRDLADLPSADALAEIARADIVVTVHSTKPELEPAFAALRARGVPTLTLQDGIIEHRHSTNGVGGKRRYRPLLTDHIAVFGRASADILASWGVAPERITVTGSPRFAASVEGPGRGLLLTTANRPTHSRRQLASLYRLMARVLEACEAEDVPVRWRPGRSLVPGRMNAPETLEDRLEADVAARFGALTPSRGALADDLTACAAVLTTPSTVALEAMAVGRPTGHLEWDDETIYLNPPWRVRRSSDLRAVVRQMMDPPPLKMAFQEATLAYQLERDDPAGRAARLIAHMAGERP